MAKKKQEQQEQSQDEHVMAVLDKRTNKTAVISKMNEQDGSIEVVPPDKKNNNSFLKLDRTTPLELFFTNFKNQYQNPTSFSFFLVPLAVLDNKYMGGSMGEHGFCACCTTMVHGSICNSEYMLCGTPILSINRHQESFHYLSQYSGHSSLGDNGTLFPLAGRSG